jgi:hypothetical protein
MTVLTPRERYGYLPAPLFFVLEAAGEEAMLRLVAACGGIRLALGRVPGPESTLARAVGLDAARSIQARCAAAHVRHFDVPLMTRTLERRRQEHILELRAAGVKVAEIARRVGMTERGVYGALARARGGRDDRQIPLFLLP